MFSVVSVCLSVPGGFHVTIMHNELNFTVQPPLPRDITVQWWIQDFPEVGAITLGAGLNTQFCQILPKLHEIEWIWTPRGMLYSEPLPPPNIGPFCVATP